jgi:tetratricopeptide (TPR) repeat protein
MIVLVPSNELEISLLIAKLYHSDNRRDDALQILNKMAQKFPEYEEIHENLCRIYLEKEDIRSARHEIELLFENDSTKYKYFFIRAEVAEAAGETETARTLKTRGAGLLQLELERNRENIPLYFERATLLQESKDFTRAVVLYDEVLSNLPSNYKALKEKARIMLMLQQWQEAISLYEKLLNLYDPEEEFYNNTAIAYTKTGDYQAALDNFSKILDINPSNTDALFNRSKLYRILGNEQKAEEDLKKLDRLIKESKAL